MTKTDLFGRPLGPQPEVTLSLTQKRQATMLYHWMSPDYLQGLKAMIDALIDGVSVDLALATAQGRDQVLANERWGVRDTAANWSTHVYPALEDFRQSTVRLLAWRTTEGYCGTGAYQCSRMISEHSSLWMTPEEEARFKAEFEKVYRYASRIDQAAGVGGERSGLNDRGMQRYWAEDGFGALFPRLPRVRVRTDIEGETGRLPPRTGVYVPQAHPYGTLQFAWIGNNDGRLGKVQTFDSSGLQAVKTLGRRSLWGDGAAIARYAAPRFESGELEVPYGWDLEAARDPQWAPTMLSQATRTELACKWYFVERIEGEFDDEATEEPVAAAQGSPLRCQSGQPCPRDGFWFTPARPDSRRRFAQGEVMPETGGDYGATIWQWDEQ